MKNGLYKKYTEKGVVLEESIFKDDLYSGLAIFRDSNGDIASRGQFVNGKKSGVWQFFEKGKLLKKIDMNDPKNWSKAKT